MLGLRSRKKPRLSVVVAFYNMQREAPRTLYSLTTDYQRDLEITDYEVIALDSGSTEPLTKTEVESIQGNFRYMYVEASAPTPCQAMNLGISAARGQWVACAIDGARIMSPGALSLCLKALSFYPNCFAYTLGMHLGPKRQNLSIPEGYCQAVEDQLLADSNWESDGYRLFDCSVLAGSSADGYFGKLSESNFFAVCRNRLQSMGGFDEQFVTPGGGFVNLDIYRRLMDSPELTPVMLLGEASFHQVHGGVSTNAPMDDRPIEQYKAEYLRLRGHEFKKPTRKPQYIGAMPDNALPFLVRKR